MMKPLIVSSVIVVCLILTSWKNHNEKPDGTNTYKEVRIGNQTWMAENLNVVTFRNGDTILEARTVDEWRAANKQKKPAWCYFNNDSTNGRKYGKLYNFHAVRDSRGLAPASWQIPAGNDWFELSDFLGDRKNAGAKLKSTSGWLKNGNGTNSTGFSGLPSGSREFAMINGDEGFGSDSSRCILWSSTITKSEDVLVFTLSWKNNRFMPIWETSVSDGYSVRCIKK